MAALDPAAGGRTAVVLFNLGGPDSLDAVEPFLRNLFSDPAIIALPGPLRRLLSRFIAGRRARVARGIYAEMGGASPLLDMTRQQAAAIQALLAGKFGSDLRVFIAMRYWHPLTEETVAEVKAFAPDRIVLLPLYPQYSTTTTASSVAAWRSAAAAAGLTAPITTVCCYPTAAGMIDAQAELVRTALATAGRSGRPRLLLSAHGLPQRVIDRGDPYQWQVERTAGNIVGRLRQPDLDWVVCYQSRVGPLRWIAPSTEAEIDRAGRDRVPVVVAPVAFVSEHSETLVELDIEYRRRALAAGVPAYVRVPALGTAPAFIAALATIIRSVRDRGGIQPEAGRRICPPSCRGCALA